MDILLNVAGRYMLFVLMFLLTVLLNIQPAIISVTACLNISTLGKTLSRRHSEIFFLIFSPGI